VSDGIGVVLRVSLKLELGSGQELYQDAFGTCKHKH
jgi:hypothetical protein